MKRGIASGAALLALCASCALTAVACGVGNAESEPSSSPIAANTNSQSETKESADTAPSVEESDGWKRPEPPAIFASLSNPLADDAEALAWGKVLYETENWPLESVPNRRYDACINCHGYYGEGDGPKADQYDPLPADLTKPGLKAMSDGYYFWRIRTGSAARSGSSMPMFVESQTNLTDKDVWSLVTYLRSMEGE